MADMRLDMIRYMNTMIMVKPAIASVVGRLVAASPEPWRSYRVTILNSPAVNAFALPGGYVYVTRGLLALASDTAEVAAVISHEMAHVTARHAFLRAQKAEAAAVGLSRTQWSVALIRRRLRDRPQFSRPEALALIEVRRELRRIGVNINQIARALNTAVMEGAV